MKLVVNNHDVYLLVSRCQLASKHAGSAHLAAWICRAQKNRKI